MQLVLRSEGASRPSFAGLHSPASKGRRSLRTAAAVAMTSRGRSEFAQHGDEDIAARFSAGDAAAFAELMQRHMGTVFGVAYGVLHDRDDAADVAQEVFLKLSQSLPRMRVHGSLGPWLYRVAMNQAIDRQRQARRRRTVSGLEEHRLSADEDDAEAVMGGIELRAVLFRAVAKLPERQRMVFTMRHVSGLSLEDIAAATNCATGTVKCHLARATRRLRELLEPYLNETCPPQEDPPGGLR